MQCMGSKRRIAKEILPIILANRAPNQWYVEPFCGGCNSIDKVDSYRLANDSNHYLIAMFKALQAGWIPPENVSKEYYNEIKNNKENYSAALVGFVGFGCSFGARWWHGYASNKEGRNYALYAKKNLLKQIKDLELVAFRSGDYRDLLMPANSVIYCDPPYANTTKYKDDFNHGDFWQWCRDKTRQGHEVFISEYSAPSDFECIKEIKTITTLHKNQKDKRTEKLFKLRVE